MVTVVVDNIEVMRRNVALVEDNYMGQELWVNAVTSDSFDGNLKARLRHLKTYGQALFDHNDKGSHHAVVYETPSISRTTIVFWACVVAVVLLSTGMSATSRARLMRRIRGIPQWLPKYDDVKDVNI
jgi:hypothetical protein